MMRTDFAETMRLAEEGRATNKKALAFGVAAVLALLFGLLLTAKPAHATTLTVNTTASDDDGRCEQPVWFNPFPDCTLREAIQRANSNNGPTVVDTINFKIPGSGVRTISPTSELPQITDPVIIDGYSQPGAKPNSQAAGNDAVLLIELNGTNAGGTSNGLLIQAPNSMVKGLVINRFTQPGIHIASDRDGEDATDNRIEGNFIGTDSSGTLDRGNFGGVWIDGFWDDINGTERNNVIGGTTPAARNILSGNDSEGVFFDKTSGNKLLGNYIGTKKDGTSPLGNSGSGVLGIGADQTTVGGTVSGAANTIAFNASDGVTIAIDSTGNRVLGNSIFSNTELGIDLEGGTENAHGRTDNDTGDPDFGPNFLQNFPAITSATRSAGTPPTVNGRLNSTPNKTFTIEFFSNLAGEDEGRTFLGSTGVTTDGSGKATFTFVAPGPVPFGSFITATATGSGGTSEFSVPREVVRG